LGYGVDRGEIYMKKRCPVCGLFMQTGFKNVWARKSEAPHQKIEIRLATESCNCGHKHVENYEKKIKSLHLKSYKEK
jgi:hypothetical protein